MKHKLIILAAAGVAAVSVQAAQALELKMSLAPPAQSPPGKYALRLAEQVKKESGGKLTIKVFFNNQLGGSEQNVIRQIVRGRIDMGMNSNTAISLVAPEFALLTAPYLWTSLKEADCVADKHLLPVYDELLQKGGVVALTWVEIGQHILFAKDKTIKTPADLSGVKFRTAPTKTDTIYLQTAGANAIPLGTAESMPALKTGVVSGASFPIVFGLAVGYHKVAPNITVTKHSHQIGAVIISKKVWNRLSKEQQGWLRSSNKTVGFMRKINRGAENGLLAMAAKKGASVHYPTDAELKAWRDKAPAAQERIIKELGGRSAEIWKKIQAARKACAS